MTEGLVHKRAEPVTYADLQAVEFSVKFEAMPFPKNGHWFAVPQVLFDDPKYGFYWLSAPKPLSSVRALVTPKSQNLLFCQLGSEDLSA